eukprot:TRINITY_DN33447_c0_g1_i1.p1 TRINITY_DN33447_c0_g1~~TRINITY_DN33447_c0_g1_i1.p1  ORF type:complete len:342 (+),score=47.24 TRINITY_DN33447_c0_g1_i1:138-1163(+)
MEERVPMAENPVGGCITPASTVLGVATAPATSVAARHPAMGGFPVTVVPAAVNVIDGDACFVAGTSLADGSSFKQFKPSEELPFHALRQVPASRGGGGVFFLKSERRDKTNMGRAGGFYERQTTADRMEHNSDDELYDEFGRKKRRKVARAGSNINVTPAASGGSAGSRSSVSERTSPEGSVTSVTGMTSVDCATRPSCASTDWAGTANTACPSPVLVAAPLLRPHIAAAGAQDIRCTENILGAVPAGTRAVVAAARATPGPNSCGVGVQSGCTQQQFWSPSAPSWLQSECWSKGGCSGGPVASEPCHSGSARWEQGVAAASWGHDACGGGNGDQSCSGWA